MSPAAAAVEADFQSPFTVKPSSSSSANPNILNPFSCTNGRLQTQNQSHNATNTNSSPGLHDAKEFRVGDGNGFVSSNGSRVGSVRRPRIMKAKKQIRRSRASATETEAGLGFNPFQSTGEDAGPINSNSCGFDSSLSNNGVSDEARVSNEYCFVNNENGGFVFGANFSSSVGADLNFEKRSTSGECTAKSGLGDDLCLNLNLKKEVGETLKKSASNQQFGVSHNDLGSSSNCKKSNCNGNASDSGLGFVFGASGCNIAASNLTPQGSDFIENNGKKVYDNQGKKEVESKMESQKVKASEAGFDGNGGFSCCEGYGEGIFVFGGGKKKSSCSDDCGILNCSNDVKLDSKSFGNADNIGKAENGNLDFDVNKKSNIASESCSSNVMGSASTTDPAFKLPGEMQKLNINEDENDDGTETKNDSNKNSCSNADTIFVFSSGINPSSSSDGRSGRADEHISGHTAAVDQMARDNFGNCNSDQNYQSFMSQAGLPKSSKVNSETQKNVATGRASLSSSSFESQQNDNVSEMPSMVGAQKDESSPTNTQHELGISFTEFVIPNWDPSCFKASLYTELNKKLEFSVKSKSIKDKRSKKTGGKSKQPSLKQGQKQVHMPKQSSSQESPSTPDCYSPMDFSPYMETTVNDQSSQEKCVTSREPLYPDNGLAPSTSHAAVTTDLDDKSFATAQKGDDEVANQNFTESNTESPWKEFVFRSETACPSFKQEQLQRGSGNAVASAEHADGMNTNSHESGKYCFASEVDGRKYFTFSSLSSADGGLTSRKCKLRKKSKKKVGNNSFVISPSPNDKVSFSHQASSSLCKTVNGEAENKYEDKVQNKFEVAEEVKQRSVSPTAAFQETCEMWRLRGNQAYKNNNLTEAEDFYTQGINSVPLSETAGCCIKPLVLCYSNRAATRISLGRMREALEDCMMAATVDPNFLKVYMRAAKCHLVLGEIENAQHYYHKLLNSAAAVCLDRRITIEAADGLQKAQKVTEYINCSGKLLEQKTSEAVSSALERINEALSISSSSEKLLEMKADALYMLRKYEEAIQLCEHTLPVAEKNFASVLADNGSVTYSLARLWRWRLISKSYFCIGKLEVALDLLQKLEQVGSISDRYGSEILESSMSLAGTVRALLHHKSAGNEAVKSRRYTEAVEHYTVALSTNIKSRPFAAICFCNRAAALQALGQIADAIADCSLAMALDENYTKAVSRRAALHEMIRDYTQAASDLQRLVSILENQSAEKAKQSRSPGRTISSRDLRQACRHLSSMEEDAKKGEPLDFYLILGVKASDTAADIKKAYRKAALKHHPDKAGQFLARTENGDEGRLWKEIAHEVHKDADRLFKMIGEAYAVLSDPTKRSEYDQEQEIRKATKESPQNSHYGRSSDAYGYACRSSRRQSRQDNWKTYGNSYSRW